VAEHSHAAADAPLDFRHSSGRLLQAFFLLCFVLCAHSAMNEWRVSTITDAAKVASTALSPAQQESLGSYWADCTQDQNTRRLEACARLHMALSQQGAPTSFSLAALARARLASTKLLNRRTGSGESVILWIVVQSLGANHSRVNDSLSSLALSYAMTPYSRSLGLWRIWYGAQHWDQLDAQTRRALLEEASWYGRIGQKDSQAVLKVLEHTQPFIAVSLRLYNQEAGKVPFPVSPE